MRRASRVKQTELVPTWTRLWRHPATAVAVSSLGLLLTVLAADAVRRTSWAIACPHSTWTIGESTMWALAAFSCVALVVSGPWLSWRLPTNRTGPCLTVAGFALAASIYGSYTPVPASPWAERLLPTVYIAAVVIAVTGWPTGHMPARWSRPFGWAVRRLRGRRNRERVRLRRSCWRASCRGGRCCWDLPTLADAATSALGSNVVAVLLHGVAPDPVPRLRRSSPREHAAERAGDLATGVRRRRWSSAPPNSGRFASSMAAAPLGGFGGRSTPIGMVGASVEFGRYGAVALLLVWSESMRRRSRTSTPSERWLRRAWVLPRPASICPTRSL